MCGACLLEQAVLVLYSSFLNVVDVEPNPENMAKVRLVLTKPLLRIVPYLRM